VEAHPSSVPQLSRGRIEALKRLERSERALADVYRYHPHDLPGGEETVQRLAREHLAHAALLRGRIEALGHEAHPDPDDSWVRGNDLKSLRWSEQVSLATYHDSLTDFDHATVEAIVGHIIPDHAHALETLDPGYDRARDGDL
jgi:hypothetical protein